MSTCLTFVIIARNEEANISRVIGSIRDAAGETASILVVDHGSQDRTGKVAKEAGADQVLLLDSGTVSEARNAGGFAVKTDWLAFIDADCELAPDWLERLEPSLADPGIYGWPVSPPQPPTWVQKAWHIHWMKKIRSQKSPPCAKATDGKGDRSQESSFRLITSANMIIHRSVFEQLNGFDPALASGEDQNLMLRAMKQSVQIKALPGLNVIHHGEPKSLKDFYWQQLWHANRGSYSRILKETGLRQGGNAPLFTILYLITLGLAVAGLLLASLIQIWFLILCFPWLGLIILPAARTAMRARQITAVFPLSVLYAVYGLARSLDLVGLNPVKRSWRP